MQCRNSHHMEVQNTVLLPKDAAFRVLQDVISDLEVCQADHALFSAIRRRDVEGTLACVSRYDARSIVNRLGGKKEDVGTFSRLYQVGALIKKYPFSGLDTFTPALKKFKEAEAQCRNYNTQNHRALQVLSRKHPKFYGLLNDLRKEIYGLIGDAPAIEAVYANGLHGPGQTAGGSFTDGKVTEYFKYSNLPYSVSTKALPHAIACIESDPRWIGALMDWYRVSNNIEMHLPINIEDFWSAVFTIVDESVITSVPKTALTDRFIAMEPTLNVFLQLGVDRVLRETLRNCWGYDLNDQRKNQELAQVGSETGAYATIDLASASDTIALILVFLLFPPMWVALFLDLRMERGRIKKTDEIITFSKLSSMGNGFTFVIESIIFGACTRVAMRRSNCYGKSAVYGDDIVCPTGAVDLLIEILDLCGFKVNSEKSFTEGPFRESCGADFYLGHNVRPLFITKKFDEVTQLFHLVNSLFLLKERWWNHGVFRQTARQRLLTWIPPNIRKECQGPVMESTDSHLFSVKPLRTDGKGYKYFYRLTERPVPYRPKRAEGYRTFMLRKLMVRLQPELRDAYGCKIERPVEKWDWRRKFDRGNAFDITRRGHTTIKIVRSYLPENWQ